MCINEPYLYSKSSKNSNKYPEFTLESSKLKRTCNRQQYPSAQTQHTDLYSLQQEADDKKHRPHSFLDIVRYPTSCNSIFSLINTLLITLQQQPQPLDLLTKACSFFHCLSRSFISFTHSCMAVSLLAREVSDLCLGKPALKSLSLTATVTEVVFALKNSDENFLSVWSCEHTGKTNKEHRGNCEEDGGDTGECKCVGKVSMVDVICYLCKDENLLSPSDALKAPVSALLPEIPGMVVHVEPTSSLLDAIDLILQGAKNLVVPIKTRYSSSSRRKQHQKLSINSPTIHNGREFCWLTQEDIIRFFLGSIGLFAPLPALSIDTLGIISTEFVTIDYHSPAISELEAISGSLADENSVAVIDSDGIFIGELSPFTLACCDESVAAAITTLSSGDLMAYIDCGGPPEYLVKLVMARLKGRGLEAMLQEFTDSSCYSSTGSCHSHSSSSSSDEESGSSTPVSALQRPGKYSRSTSYSARMVRRAEAIVCHPKSSLVAVMFQAIAHRVNYVWVIEHDCSLVGIVRFCDMLEVFRESLEDMV
ncbi:CYSTATHIONINE BETA-SYNTHASE (CBS) FAMILY PROTEIN-RELATED [Salix viminalis]|uniref:CYSTATHIONINE BETA-SYNTHASE (CBS) FAMILY PROTEIN-RELATED n=1 Tax=Salix viminalis TaxID=40686 RepID=A0A9Q0U6U4_SALVM|nr:CYSTATHIONINE BETA-SYNTHASE (CBS) FAMILY PROTEIN-RELATED [Salix viminalis]